MDTRTPEQRRRIMQSVGSKDTGPELVVRRLLHGMGYRYRLHRKDLPGRPDIALRPPAQGDLRPRLLLARPRLPQGAPAEIPPRLLATQG